MLKSWCFVVYRPPNSGTCTSALDSVRLNDFGNYTIIVRDFNFPNVNRILSSCHQ